MYLYVDMPKLLLKITCLLIGLFGSASSLFAFPKEHYANSSALASGNWVKIEVAETGMQFISDATLKSMGFSDPEKVNIYGYGGVMIPENLDSPDDLPLVESLRVDGGVLFFGVANVGWQQNSNSQRKYSHISHPYSDKAYYFVSDRDGDLKTPEQAAPALDPVNNVTEFRERIVHEKDIAMPINTGRFMFGEDFKSQSSRNFSFSLPGNIGNATVTTVFAVNSSSGVSSLVFTANGTQLDASTTDRISAASNKLLVTATTVKEVKNPGESLDFGIKFNPSGYINFANLDFIEVEYPRELALTNDELYFYLPLESSSTVSIKGADASTIVWDVTNPVNPKQLSVKTDNGLLSFTAPSGYHEFVAFNPAAKKRQPTNVGKIENQDLHSLSAPGMLVITPSEYKYAAQRLADIHAATDGLSLIFLTPEEIYNEFSSGKPDVSAFRKLLKMWYDRAEGREGEFTEYCLIFSRPTYDNKLITPQVRNAGYPRVPIWQSPTGDTKSTSYSTDDYIGMLEDVTGNFNIATAKINVAVGRMAVKSVAEINSSLDKLEKYLLTPDLGAWRNNVMVIADDEDNGVHLNQAESVISALKSAGNGSHYLYEKLYLDAYQREASSVGQSYPLAHERMMNLWNEGVAYINYIGHANEKTWGHEFLLRWTDIISMSNKRLPFLYAATCDFMRWDEDDYSGGETLWLLPNSGVIAMICPSREVLISSNGVLNEATSKLFFKTDENGNTMPLGKIMIQGKNASNTGSNKLHYGFLGDPSMRLPGPTHTVKIDEINGINLSDATDLPVLPARSSVKLNGHVQDNYGNPLSDFNGIAEISIYDAEKVITTNGNGDDGVVSMYNDRKTRLFKGRAKVTDGTFSLDFTMPSEIENNFSPALISLYASDSQNREANGACEDFYAYGYDESAPDDFDGPTIKAFYLNSPSFASGNEVGPNPILYASFFDESGISLSEAGIGHSITLDLDGKTFFDDVASYLLPDENDSRAGSITYPLGEIEPGSHTLRLILWDNANNSTTVSLEFKISAIWKPSIDNLTTDQNPATSSVNFIISTDGSSPSMQCMIDVYDIWGRRVWHNKAAGSSGIGNRTTLNWDLCDFAGAKVPAGVYIYKATVTTENGGQVTKSKKLVVR